MNKTKSGFIPAKARFSIPELCELTALVSPFSEEARGAKVLDSYSGVTGAVTLTWSFTYTSDASGLGCLQFHPYCMAEQIPDIYSTHGAAPAGVTNHPCQQSAAFLAMVGNRRCVGFGMKAMNTYPALSTQGKVRAGACRGVLQYSAGGFSTWQSIMDGLKNNFGDYSLAAPDDGCQVRWQPDEKEDVNYRFFDGGVDYGRNGVENFPTMCFQGMANGQTCQIIAVAHYEILTNATDIVPSTPSPVGCHHDELIMVASRAPISASAHSFWKYAKIAVRAAGVLNQILTVGLPILATLV